MRLLVYAIILFLFLPGCRPESGSGSIGPCVHEYLEPVLQFSGITSGGELMSADTIYITGLKLNGTKVNAIFTTGISENVTVDDEVITCTLPCGFGFEEGGYTFYAFNDELPETSFSFTAQYASSGGGCPSFSADGTVVQLDF